MKNLKLVFFALLSLVVLSSCEEPDDSAPDVIESNAVVEFEDLLGTVEITTPDVIIPVRIPIVLVEGTKPTEWPITVDYTIEGITNGGDAEHKSLIITEENQNDTGVALNFRHPANKELIEKEMTFKITITDVRGEGVTLNPNKKEYVLTVKTIPQ